jgi:hypothetical protein
MCVMSSVGNAEERDQYKQEHAKEVKGMSDAFCNISGFKFTPVHDQEGKIVGTSVVF